MITNWTTAAALSRLVVLGAAVVWLTAYAPLAIAIHDVYMLAEAQKSEFVKTLKGFRDATGAMIVLLVLVALTPLAIIANEHVLGWGASAYDAMIVLSSVGATILAPAPLYVVIRSFFVLEAQTDEA